MRHVTGKTTLASSFAWEAGAKLWRADPFDPAGTLLILQTLHDFDRWKEEGQLLAYKPLDWDAVLPQYADHPPLRADRGWAVVACPSGRYPARSRECLWRSVRGDGPPERELEDRRTERLRHFDDCRIFWPPSGWKAARSSRSCPTGPCRRAAYTRFFRQPGFARHRSPASSPCWQPR